MTNKKAVKITALLVAFACVAVALSVGLASCDSDFYTTEQHVKRISARVQERFIDTGEHESFKLYPLYHQDEEITHFLVEFPSDGYLYVKLSFKLIYGHDMYLCNDDTEYSPWFRYRYTMDSPAYDAGIRWLYAGDGLEVDKDNSTMSRDAYVEVNEDGKAIERTVSHFVAAGIGEEERRYLIETSEHDYIPAVKRDGKFLNLVSMELCDLDEIIRFVLWGRGIAFTPKHDFDL